MFKHIALFTALSALAAIPVARGAVIDVIVGGAAPNTLKFQPDSVVANIGDTVRFTFKQKNHTVTQSTLATPCAPKDGGFDSGFIPVQDGAVSFPVAELDIHDLNPVWVYCAQAGHCAQGMVFAVNPGDKMDQFRGAATGAVPPSSAAPSSAAPVSSAPPATTSAAAAAAPSVSAGTDHRIVVGGPGKLFFDPSNIQAAPGDTVTFEFHQKSHSVTQSSFDIPCSPLSSGQGFDSGLTPVDDSVQANFPTWTVKVNDTNPIWAYCKQANHCQQGMVFSVNANEQSDKSFAAFKTKAMSSGTNTTTGSTSNTTQSSQPNAAASPVTASFRDAGIALTVLALGALVL